MKESDVLYIERDDIPYEEDILRNPFQVKNWMRYLLHKQTGSYKAQCYLYERAVKEVPRSYKLWIKYLEFRMNHDLQLYILDKEYDDTNNCFERALMYLNKMPRVWITYLEFLVKQRKITLTRRVFNEALRAIPVTQHERLWEVYLPYVQRVNLPQLACSAFERYLKLFPEHIENYIDYLMEAGLYDKAAVMILHVLNLDDKFVSIKEKSNYSFWVDLCNLICDHPEEIKSIDVDSVIRSGLLKFKDQVGKLWISLADFYIFNGNFYKARDIYEEAIDSVLTVRDFTQIFEAYSNFEEAIISKQMQDSNIDGLELDLRLAYYENLIEKRPFLLNKVLLRQNPNNVHQWLKGVDLHLKKNNIDKVIETFELAVESVDPKKSYGKFHELWIQFALFYAANDDIDTCREIFEKAVEVDFKNVNDLADVWIAYSDFELEMNEFDRAISVLNRAVTPLKLKVNYYDKDLSCQVRLYKCLKLWQHYLDLEESMGNVERTRALYERILDLKIANPQMIINYAIFLEENKYFEESFKVYEKGVDLFTFPIAFEIWNIYLPKFVERYKGTKIERTRGKETTFK
jgi:pre-mRNA-splicing factor SYF1